MPLSRRQFLHHSVATAAIGGVALPSAGALWRRPGVASPSDLPSDAHGPLAPLADPTTLHALATRAMDTARAAGATYADVRLTRIVTQQYWYSQDSVVGAIVTDAEQFGVGVRALVNGAWGFAASPYWELDEVVALAREAVSEASTNARGRPQPIDLGTLPVATGTWTTPGVDPFSIPVEEKIDCMNAWRNDANDYLGTRLVAAPGQSLFRPQMSFVREERVLATTDGTYVTQTLFQTGGDLQLDVFADRRALAEGQVSFSLHADGLSLQGRGWDLFTDARLREQIPTLLATAEHDLAAPPIRHKPVQLGRYDVVFDAATMASLLDQTIGVATQLDRALGYEANAAGTSYLGPDPLAWLGTTIGAPLLTVTANRALPGGLATVRWDDEGVEPREFPLVQHGVLVDYQTTREQAPWLAPWYAKRGVPVRSRGCAGAASALSETIQQTPNLTLAPSQQAASFDDLVADTPRGVAFLGGMVFADMQAKTGAGFGDCREIVHGKLGARLQGARYAFNAMEFWKNLIALGGPASVEQTMAQQTKGQPTQQSFHTVSAVPAKVARVDILGAGR